MEINLHWLYVVYFAFLWFFFLLQMILNQSTLSIRWTIFHHQMSTDTSLRFTPVKPPEVRKCLTLTMWRTSSGQHMSEFIWVCFGVNAVLISYWLDLKKGIKKHWTWFLKRNNVCVCVCFAVMRGAPPLPPVGRWTLWAVCIYTHTQVTQILHPIYHVSLLLSYIPHHVTPSVRLGKSQLQVILFFTHRGHVLFSWRGDVHVKLWWCHVFISSPEL